VLFDTGEKGEWLSHNMEVSGVDISAIESVVISHDHWDHTGGLWEILKRNQNLTVYACPGFGDEFRQKVEKSGASLALISSFTRIAGQIYLSGEIDAIYKGEHLAEQSLILDTPDTISILTGCAHPGIINIINQAKRLFPSKPLDTVLGGFHLMNSTQIEINEIVKKLTSLNLRQVAPTHCTGAEAEQAFEHAFGKSFLDVLVGKSVWV
jgi:7,8-dihydropterin-6-yl-methyl-4-(beta-D-ribofuranosyl)aminobenzene 5'-phosphate synthase